LKPVALEIQKMTTQIFIRLKGGLGNQLFQYAFGLYLQRCGFNIVGYFFDYSQDSYGHNYQLNHIIPDEKISICKIPNSTILVQSENAEAIKKFIIQDNPKFVLIEGYFQNVEYIEKSELNKIIHLKSHRNPLTAIHIRRGDYGHHGHLPVKYYTDALNYLGTPEFEVFSDEPNFSEYVFSKIDGFRRVIRPNLDLPVEELISLASHSSIVMANSSFSWIGSYLAYKNNNSKIAYPKQWSFIGTSPGAYDDWFEIDSKLITP
jgi:hypothetical protein